MAKFKIGDCVKQGLPFGDDTNETMISHWNDFWKKIEGPLVDNKFYITGVIAQDYYAYSNKPNGDGPQIHEKYLELVNLATTISDEPFITVTPPKPARRALKDYELVTTNDARVQMFACERDIVLETSDFRFEHEDLDELISFLEKVRDVLKENANDAS